MVDTYDKSLHAPRQYKTMESPPQELDEVALDAAIAGLIGGCEPEETPRRSEFPDLLPQDPAVTDAQQDSGVGAVLRQTWAQLSGAA